MELNFDFQNQDFSFEKKSNYEADSRFYNLAKDKEGNGAAIIRFLPSKTTNADGSLQTMIEVFKFNFHNPLTKRFYNEWSPITIGGKDPVQEKWSSLWNAGNKDEAKKFSRIKRYLANILIVKDPKNPENEGKVFLIDLNQTLANKIQSFLRPTQADLDLGQTPKNLFHPISGFDFKLVSSKGSNGFITYDKSAPVDTPRPIAGSTEEAVNFIKENCFDLSEWNTSQSYKTYDELKEIMDQVLETSGSTESNPQVKTEPEAPVNPVNSSISNELDDLVASLSK